MAENAACELCKELVVCTTPPTSLCEDCLQLHSAQYPIVPHQYLPMSATQKATGIEDRKEEIATHLPPSLVYISRRHVGVLNFSTRVWDFHDLQIDSEQITIREEGSRYVWVERGLFCCGGKDYTGRGDDGIPKSDAYLLGNEWKVTKWTDMIMPRAGQGVWWHAASSSVLVFGGIS